MKFCIPWQGPAALVLFSAASVSASASSFYMMVPMPGKSHSGSPANPGGSLPPVQEVDPENIQLTLESAPTFRPEIGYPFTFNMTELLSVTGDPSYNGSGVSFDYRFDQSWTPPNPFDPPTVFNFPSGIMLSPDGKLRGQPWEVDGNLYKFTAVASYKGKSTHREFQIAVQPGPEINWQNVNYSSARIGSSVSMDLSSFVRIQDYRNLVDLDPVTFEVENLPPGLSMTSLGRITGVAPQSAGRYPYHVTARYRGRAISQDFFLDAFHVEVALPSRIVFPDAEEGVGLSLWLSHLNVTGDPGWGTTTWQLINPSTHFYLAEYGAISIRNSAPPPGSYELPIRATYVASDGERYERDTLVVINVIKARTVSD